MTKLKSISSSNGNGALVTIEEFDKDKETGFFVQKHVAMPGFVGTKHRHTDFEWVYIVRGELSDEFGSYPEGSFKKNGKGTVHKPFTIPGYTILVFSHGEQVQVREEK